MKYGLIKVAAAAGGVRVADVEYNLQQMESLIAQAEGRGAEVVVLPELSVTGATCQDLFLQQMLTDKAEEGLLILLDFTRKLDIIVVVGLPVRIGALVYDCAAVVQHGTLLALVPKCLTGNDGRRWFAPAASLQPQDVYLAGSPVHVSAEPLLLRTADGVMLGIEIGSDAMAPVPPSARLTAMGADIVLCLAADATTAGSHDRLVARLTEQSRRYCCAYVYASAGHGESTQDAVYQAETLVVDNGEVVAQPARFSLEPLLRVQQVDVEALRINRQSSGLCTETERGTLRVVDCKPVTPRDFELLRTVEPHPFLPSEAERGAKCEEVVSLQTLALIRRMQHAHVDRVVIGISGGLDSTLALLVAVRAFDRLALPPGRIVCVTMPGPGTSDRTHTNATQLMTSLGVTQREIPIAAALAQHLSDIGHDGRQHDTTYENAQARERTQILMDIANKVGGIVIGTGDMSELALGWCTLGGDQMAMYGVNAGVPKTLVAELVRHQASLPLFAAEGSILLDIVDTPISPELTPLAEDGTMAQHTEDIVGPYELHDFFLYHLLHHGFRPQKLYVLACSAFGGKYAEDEVRRWLTVFCQRFFSQQFKRSPMPDGAAVLDVSLSPRGGWLMPSDAMGTLWIKECEALGK